MSWQITSIWRRAKQAAAVGLLSLLLLPGTAGALSAAQIPAAVIPTTIAATSSSGLVKQCTKSGFFGLKPWYQYMGHELDDGSEKADSTGQKYKCDVKCFNIFTQSTANLCGQTKSDIPLVLLAIIDDLLRITGIAAVGFIIYGAFRYTASQGSPEQTSKAQNTIINALLGLAISIISIAFVSYLGNTLGT